MSFTHNARLVILDHFGFDVGDRFTHTYDFTAYWLCDIRVEAIEPLSTATPRCTAVVRCATKSGESKTPMTFNTGRCLALYRFQTFDSSTARAQSGRQRPTAC